MPRRAGRQQWSSSHEVRRSLKCSWCADNLFDSLTIRATYSYDLRSQSYQHPVPVCGLQGDRKHARYPRESKGITRVVNQSWAQTHQVAIMDRIRQNKNEMQSFKNCKPLATFRRKMQRSEPLFSHFRL